MNGVIEKSSFSFTGMDTRITVTSAEAIEEKVKNKVHKWFRDFEEIASRFIETSELSRLNHSPANQVIVIHPELYGVLEAAMNYAKQTDFYFNPFIGSAINYAGYRESFKPNQHIQSNQKTFKFEQANEKSMWFFPSVSAVAKRIDQHLDLGGIGKGWCVDKAVAIMKGAGINAGIINAGGDLYKWGSSKRLLGIAHPLQEDNDIARFTIAKDIGIATSNTVYRCWKKDNKNRHHILNGLTGKPAETDVIQATVFTNSTAKAEVLAKILCTFSFAEGMKWLNEMFPDAAACMINENGKVAISKHISDFVCKMEF